MSFQAKRTVISSVPPCVISSGAPCHFERPTLCHFERSEKSLCMAEREIFMYGGARNLYV